MRIEDFGFCALGQLASKCSVDINSSRLGIGFETLDRDMWDVNQAWPVLNELGVKWARVQSGWAKTERERGIYDFKWLDEIVDNLLKRGVQPWLSVSYGNSLYTADATPDGAGFPPIYTELERQAWINYVKALALHYKDRVTHFEIWNEPDCSGFFKPQVDPVLYADLVRLTVPAIKAVHADSVIIGGAFGSAMNPGGLAFLETCFEHGMAEFCDIISYHGYKFLPEQYIEQEFPAFIALLKKYKPSLGYWQGETGCPSKNPPGNTMALNEMKVSEAIQVKWLLRRVLLELGLDAQMINYFTMGDFGKYLLGGDLGFSSHKGLLRLEDGSRKPAYFALQTLASLLHDPLEVANGRTSFRLQTGDDDHAITREQAAAAYQVNLVRGDVPVHAWWLRESVEQETEWKSITMYYWLEQGLKLEDPVLINPATGEVYQLDLKRNYNMNEFANLPISNSPLLLTDRSILEIS
ncbi:beta-galactosidase [Coraliomargarita algicola]|uniref:Beta-galactosidase n=1 Tax=Coraliomargarita algicola TaxID=3092156 RepID=A0ABZ0RPW7_9BACT|nr:beta-galactosidase [Coraliomargarita sp. J2-16]WPJ97471.1 beta-galactosidase [Coraliomargarita sp. J2-16]